MRRKIRGSQAVEFALVTPIFIVLLAAIIDYGWYFQQQSVTNTVVRDAARKGAIVDAASGRSVGCQELFDQGLIATNSATCSELTVVTSGTSPDQIVTVNCNVTYRPLFGIMKIGPVGDMLPTNIHSDLVMKVEQ